MYISKIRVQNYKAFHDSGWIEFKPGINIISGQNHSGKTALLEALSFNFKNLPHISLKTLPIPSSKILGFSQIQAGFSLTVKEIVNLIKEDNNFLILPARDRDVRLDDLFRDLKLKLQTKDFLEISIPFVYCGIHNNFIISNKNIMKKLALDLYNPIYKENANADPDVHNHDSFLVHRVKVDSNFEEMELVHDTSLNVYGTTIGKLINQHVGKVYRFYAERKTVGIYNFGDNLKLNPDASNLAEVVHCLQSRFPNKYNQFNNLVSVVLPHIRRISTRPIIDEINKVELRIWSIDPETDREDLAFPLEACGTGVGQVLAILYVVVTSEEPRTIIIDEPQSFLHPGAARKLIEILQDFPQHQYFISTHSPSIIAAANPSSITLLKYQDSEATPLSISADDSEEMRSLLDEVGVHLSDVFGSDNILWVEGPTEERCFPIILRQIAKIPLRGTQILVLKNTGDLEGRKSEIYFDIYDRLSGGKALLPPAVEFVLDSENKSEKNLEDLKKRSGDKLHFINRCMYENYLLDTEAITAIANQHDFRDEPIEVLEIEQWISKRKQEWIDKQIKKGTQKEDLTDDYWLSKVHAAKLLENLFRHFSDKKVVYRKTTHSIELTKWLVQNKPEQLQDIADLLKNILGRSPDKQS